MRLNPRPLYDTYQGVAGLTREDWIMILDASAENNVKWSPEALANSHPEITDDGSHGEVNRLIAAVRLALTDLQGGCPTVLKGSGAIAYQGKGDTITLIVTRLETLRQVLTGASLEWFVREEFFRENGIERPTEHVRLNNIVKLFDINLDAERQERYCSYHKKSLRTLDKFAINRRRERIDEKIKTRKWMSDIMAAFRARRASATANA